MDSDSDLSEIMEHKGYKYEKKWKSVAADGWALWKCVANGCPGQLAMSAVRKKRWRRKRIVVHKNIGGNGLTAFVPRRPHNHKPGKASAKLQPAVSHSDADALGMASQNKNEKIVCQVCDALFDKFYYEQHVKTVQHISVYDRHFKERIDFENYRIFSSSACVTKTEFFNAIEKDFIILADHILLLENEVVIDIYFYALYHEDSLNPENKNIAEVKHFDVYNKELTKNTNVFKLYKDVVNALMFQSDALKTSEFSWTLEETLYVEFSVVKKLLNDKVAENSLVEITNNNQSDNLIKTDKLQKTEPLQLFQCKQCNVYVVQTNHEQHLQTTAHQISLCYLNNEKIQINGQCKNQLVSCRILSSKHNISIDHFFLSIESDALDLIDRIIKLQNHKSVNVNLQMFGLYSHKDLLSETDNLGNVKSFMIKNEILSAATMLLVWLKKLTDSFKCHHQNYLKTMPATYYLDRVMFLDLFFYEITTI